MSKKVIHEHLNSLSNQKFALLMGVVLPEIVDIIKPELGQNAIDFEFRLTGANLQLRLEIKIFDLIPMIFKIYKKYRSDSYSATCRASIFNNHNCNIRIQEIIQDISARLVELRNSDMQNRKPLFYKTTR